MTSDETVARRKLSQLELAKNLQNVSKACQIMGYSRQQFYEIRRNYQTFGSEGLLDKLPGPHGSHPNPVRKEIEQAILHHCLKSQRGLVRVPKSSLCKAYRSVPVAYAESGVDTTC